MQSSWGPCAGFRGINLDGLETRVVIEVETTLRQTQRSPEGPRHLHRIPRLSEAPWASALSLLHSPTLTSIHDHRKNHVAPDPAESRGAPPPPQDPSPLRGSKFRSPS